MTSVTSRSPSDNSGIEPNDIITGIGSRKVRSSADAVAQIRVAENENKPVLPLLLHDGTNTSFHLEFRGG
jgi:S1-C subfamily serine protease